MARINLTVIQRVDALRSWMEENDFDAFIIPTGDPHNCEYLPEHWKVREWLTGFTGSAGLAVVTMNDAALWTDSRYFIQAEEQLHGTPFTLMREGEPGVPSFQEWLFESHDVQYVGFCPDMLSSNLYSEIEDFIEGLERFADICPSETDPFDEIWTNRPALPKSPVSLFPLEYAGKTFQQKINELRLLLSVLSEGGGFFVHDLADIAWLLNIRGNDIEFNPLSLAYLFVTQQEVVLMIDSDKLGKAEKAYLKENGITLCDYDNWKEVLLTEVKKNHGMLIHVSPSISCDKVDFMEENDIDYEVIPSPLEVMRSVKTPEEIKGFRRAMEEDGAAMVKFLRWLESAVPQGGVTEIEVDRRLTDFRKQSLLFKDLSFATIAAYGPHGAIVHYEAEPSTDAELKPEGLLLLDSGAHYACGTTDITRTIALGNVTEEEKKAYTLVLKGHIALSRMRFPNAITGLQMDTAARYAMWQEGYDFGHGTGHGVGCCLPVHEGPLQIRKQHRHDTVQPYGPGIVTSNEPGIYVAGKFGVRIENLILVENAETTAFGEFCKFETLTLCPYDLTPVDFNLLSPAEINWINDYHAMVCNRLLPLLTDESDRQWLVRATQAIQK